MSALEKRIGKWKKNLRKYQSIEDGYADELENHLRDLIEEFLGEGLTQEEAFLKASRIMGDSEIISAEYYSGNEKSGKRPPWKSNPLVPDLFSNFIKIGLRLMRRNSGYTFINVSGLAIGLASVIVLLSFIKYELSYDSFNEKKENIYRIYLQRENNGNMNNFAPVMLPLVPAVETDIPEIESAVRVSYANRLLRYEDKSFYERIVFVDDDIFNVFSFNLITGNPVTILSEPNQITISETMAEKYFGSNDVLGKTLIVNNREVFVVTGVFEDIPYNSHFRTDIMGSISTLYKEELTRLSEWTHLSNDYAYVLLNENTNASEVETKFKGVIEKNMPPEDASKYNIKLQPLMDVHLSNLYYDAARTTSAAYLMIFGVIAFFILIVACINFVNLSTARAARRYREVGVRKSLGAQMGQLVFQFLSESFFYVFLSFFLALATVYLILPDANYLFRSHMSINEIFDREGIILFAVILFITGLLSGCYPAFVLAKFKPTSIIGNLGHGGQGNERFRKLLVISQFAISIFLILGSITIYRQISFMTEAELGFESDQIAVVPIYDSELRKSPERFRNDLLALNGIEQVTFSSGTPASGTTRTDNVFPENQEKDLNMQILEVDENFINSYEIVLLEGRNFNSEIITDLTDAFIINETALNEIGWQQAVNKTLKIGDEEPHKIIGVIKDFNYESLRYNVEPMLLKYEKSNLPFCSIKITEGNKEEVYKNIESVFLKHTDGYPFEGYLMDEQYMDFYRFENRIGTLVSSFAGLAIVISCLGILGLVSYMVEQKKKEIALRKVLGAPVNVIVGLLVKQFIIWVFIANLVVWPLAYYGLENWLSNFAYRTEIGIHVFVIAALASVLMALLTVSFHVLKASVLNPINSLRHE